MQLAFDGQAVGSAVCQPPLQDKKQSQGPQYLNVTPSYALEFLGRHSQTPSGMTQLFIDPFWLPSSFALCTSSFPLRCHPAVVNFARHGSGLHRKGWQGGAHRCNESTELSFQLHSRDSRSRDCPSQCRAEIKALLVNFDHQAEISLQGAPKVYLTIKDPQERKYLGRVICYWGHLLVHSHTFGWHYQQCRKKRAQNMECPPLEGLVTFMQAVQDFQTNGMISTGLEHMLAFTGLKAKELVPGNDPGVEAEASSSAVPQRSAAADKTSGGYVAAPDASYWKMNRQWASRGGICLG